VRHAIAVSSRWINANTCVITRPRCPLTDGKERKQHTMRVYYDHDADVGLIKGKNVAIIGYGS
jgi:hypothetical protein